jgi:hypothetical protein
MGDGFDAAAVAKRIRERNRICRRQKCGAGKRSGIDQWIWEILRLRERGFPYTEISRWLLDNAQLRVHPTTVWRLARTMEIRHEAK